MEKKYYPENKCECIAGEEIVGMGKESDEHLTCHKCGSALFPWERQNATCGGCQQIENYKEAGCFNEV